MANGSLRMVGGSRETRALYGGEMQPSFISGRSALAAAAQLIEQFGEDAGLEAAARADRSRELGNVQHFCRWREVERVIVTLSCSEVSGRVH